MTPNEPPTALQPRDFRRAVLAAHPLAAQPERVKWLTINVGLRCDLACAHCHHACSPLRTEVMSRETMLDTVAFAEMIQPDLVDITGGEPELFAHLRELVERARVAGLAVRVRTNLIALAEPNAATLPAFFAEQGVALLASLPGVSAAQSVEQRGSEAVWNTSIAVLRELAELGYGSHEDLVLEIAHNPPLGEFGRPQCGVEAEFRRALQPLGVRFNSLLALPNVPIGRFRERLRAGGEYHSYVARLSAAFNPLVAAELECRHGLEVAWDGTLWDCDFNLGAGVRPTAGPLTIAEALANPDSLRDRRIGFGPHCFACTVGAGSG